MAEDILDDYVSESEKMIRRRSLIPLWMKVFVWIFMIMGIMIIPAFILGISGGNFELQLYGWATNKPLSRIGILLTILFILKGVVAYFLWFENSRAIVLALVDSIVGIVLCIVSMAGFSIVAGVENSPGFRIEVVFLIPYCLKLIKIKKEWRLASAN